MRYVNQRLDLGPQSCANAGPAQRVKVLYFPFSIVVLFSCRSPQLANDVLERLDNL